MADDFTVDNGWEMFVNQVQIELQFRERVRISQSNLVNIFFNVKVEGQTQDVSVTMMRRLVIENLRCRHSLPSSNNICAIKYNLAQILQNSSYQWGRVMDLISGVNPALSNVDSLLKLIMFKIIL